jgi:regulator of replication initiation timing
LETERCLQQSQEEIKRLKEFEKLASTKIRAAESAHKSAEAGLVNMGRQVTELKQALDQEFASGSQLRLENSQLKDAFTEAEAKAQKVDEQAQAYYDQGFTEAADSLLLQLKGKCDKFFIQGWHKALDKVRVDDASELYDLAHRNRPFRGLVSEEHDGEAGEEVADDSMVLGSHEVLNEPALAEDLEVTEDRAEDQIQAVGGEDDSEAEENIDVID